MLGQIKDCMIDIIIVNWNAGGQLKDCLTSIERYGDGFVGSVVVVDNSSTDGSADVIEGQFDLPIRVIRNAKNLGFGAACNLGARNGNSSYLLFLNPDTRCYEGSLSVPLSFMARRENADIGICGIQLIDESGHVSRSCAHFPTLGRLLASILGFDKLHGFGGIGIGMLSWDHSTTRRVDHVMGAFFLLRRSVFDACGSFDERFFVYLEDVDLSFRAYQQGWYSVYLAEAKCFHAGGGTSRKAKAYRLFYSLRSRLLYAGKHFARWQFWILMGFTLLVEPVSRMAYGWFSEGLPGVRNTWAAYRMLWPNIRRIARGEGRFQP